MSNTQPKSDWLLNTQSRVLQADWLMLENNEKATLNINMPYSKCERQRNKETNEMKCKQK